MTKRVAATDEPEPTVQVNIPVPESLHRRLKMAAAEDGLFVRDAVLAAIEAWCGGAP